MTSFDKKPVKKVVAVTAVHGKKMDTKKQKPDQNNLSHHQQLIAKVSLGYVIRLALKVAQHKMRRLIQYFSSLVKGCFGSCLEWVIVILSSIFFVTKLIFKKTETREQLNKDIRPEFLALLDDDKENADFHVIHKLKVIEETNEVMECCRIMRGQEPIIVEPTPAPQRTNDERKRTELVEPSEDCEYYGFSVKPDETKIDVSDEPEADRCIREQPRPRPRHRLVRRLSNVERFYLENPKAAKGKKVKNPTKVLFSIVYMSCAFVITQFYLLISALLSTTLPSGLLFLITSLIGVATIVLQMVFPGKKKSVTHKHQEQSGNAEPKKKTRECSVQTVNPILLDVAPLNGKRVKPVQTVHPFILRRLSSKDLWKMCRVQQATGTPQIESAPVVY